MSRLINRLNTPTDTKDLRHVSKASRRFWILVLFLVIETSCHTALSGLKPLALTREHRGPGSENLEDHSLPAHLFRYEGRSSDINPLG